LTVPKKNAELDPNEWYQLDDEDEEDEIRICDNCCPHYDGLNMCCWQSGRWGLCFDVREYDECHLGYTENDPR